MGDSSDLSLDCLSRIVHFFNTDTPKARNRFPPFEYKESLLRYIDLATAVTKATTVVHQISLMRK